MSPEQLWRWPQPTARESLARRLGLAVAPLSRGWEVAAAARLDELPAIYQAALLANDKRAVLIEGLRQSLKERCAAAMRDRTVSLIAHPTAYHKVAGR